MRDSFLPDSSLELGSAMTRLRGSRSLRAVERAAGNHLGTSKSALDRYEKGRLPPLELAAVLDAAYRADGWLVFAMNRLWRKSWNPWDETWPAHEHMHAWPAAYEGLVWVDLRPRHANVGSRHRLELDWAPWHRDLELELPADGVVVVTGKAADLDGTSRTLNLRASLPLFALWGAGDPDAEQRVDIRRGWVRAEPPGPEDVHGPLREYD